MPLKTKGYKNVVRFDFFDNAKCSAFLDAAPRPVFKEFFDHFIKNTVCGQYTLSKVGPNNVSITTTYYNFVYSSNINSPTRVLIFKWKTYPIIN